MTVTYDSCGSPSQLGSDLQQFSSNGWSFTDGRSHWDGGQNSTARNTYADSLVSLCVHQGQLHVAWVEAQDVSGTKKARGPYVARWNGSSWTALGSEVDPSITPIDIAYPSPGYGSFEITDPTGTRWRPARPKLVSDGTDLFCVYTVQEVIAAPGSVYLPPNGVTAPGGTTVGVTHPWTSWAPRKTYVRKWSGSSWDLYGELNALTFNDGQGAGASPSPGTAAARNATASQGILLDLGACASPNMPGVVYVAMFEQGPNSTLNYYTSGGTTFFSPNRCVLQIAKFDGSGTSGTVTQITDNSTQTAFSSTLNSSLSSGTNGQTITAVGEANVVVRNENGAMVLWHYNQRPGGVPTEGYRMTAIDTNVDKTTNAQPINKFPLLLIYQAARGKYLVQADAFYDCPADGSSASFTTHWNGDTVSSQWCAALAEGGLANLNVWLVSNASANPDSTGDVFLYHHNCFAMTDETYPTPSSSTQQMVGKPDLALIGDTLYAACAVRDSTNTAVDLKTRVYSMAITRGSGSCAGTPPTGTARSWATLI